MADNNTESSLDVNIASPVNGDASPDSDTLTPPKSESYAAVLRGDNDHHHNDHHHNNHHDHHHKSRIEELEREISQLKEDNKAMDSIAKRAFVLEGEVVNLQHDLGTAMNAGDEAGKEIERLNKEIDDLRSEKSALGRKIGDLEREKESAEEKAKARLDELEGEINQVKKEKNLVEEAMGVLEAELKASEGKVAQMVVKIEELAKNTEESEEIIAGMVEKAEKATERGIEEVVSEVGFLKRKVSVPVVGVVSAGVVVAAVVVCCVRFGRMR